MLPPTSDHRILTLLVDDPPAQLKFTEQMTTNVQAIRELDTNTRPDFMVPIGEIVKQFCPRLLAIAEKTAAIKSDGAVDEIPVPEEKRLINTEEILINIRIQRVDSINEEKIIENLKKDGGFSHKTAGTVDTFVSEFGDSSPDGMHRAIKAFICKVPQIAIQRQGKHEDGATEQEMIDAEYAFFIAKNKRNSPVNESSIKRADKNSGNMSASDRQLDELFASIGIRVNNWGASEEDAHITYPDGHENMKALLVNEKSNMRMSEDTFVENIPFLKEVTTNRTQLDGAFVKCCEILGPEYVNFHKWVKSDSYKVIPREYWTAKNQHGKGMETAVIRLALCFNEWMKEKMGMEVVSKEMFEGFIDKMGTETHHFIHSCLIEGESVNESLLQWFDED